jgi:hypothetical protein
LEILNLPLPEDALLPKAIPIIEGHPIQFENYSFSIG